MVEELKPDISIMDISMRGMSGLEATQEITKRNPNSKVLVFTIHDGPGLAAFVREAGARGVVTKSQGVRDLISAIECVLNGDNFFNDETRKTVEAPDKPGSGSVARESPKLKAFQNSYRLR